MADKAYEYMDWPRIEAIVYGEEASPRDVMQPMVTEDGVLIQGFFPGTDAAEVVVGKTSYPMILEDEAGYYAVMLPLKRIPEYRFRVTRGSMKETFYDAYECPCQITEEEEKAFCAGVYYKAYEKLGAHPGICGGVKGTYFAVWAPNAIRVSVVGDFDRWDGRRLPMHRMPMSGIFELFVPGVQAGVSYQYEIKIKGGNVQRKSDPYGNGTQGAPSVISVVTDLGDFSWQDEAWMKEREKFASREVPVSIYETDVTEWKNSSELVAFLKETGYTHVEFHPVMEYLDQSSGGYSTSSYYAVTTRFGTAADFRALVEDLHQAGIGVILDWAPAQFPRFDAGLEKFDGTPLYEVQDPAMAVHPMWGTMLYNYGSPMVKDFLISNAFFWLDEFHIDALRVDAVSSMLYLDYSREAGQWHPNIYGGRENLEAIDFLKEANATAYKNNPGIMMIAEESTAYPGITAPTDAGGLGFGLKWNMGWMHDTLQYLHEEPINRKWHHNEITFSMVYAYSEHYVLPISHDEVVYGKGSMFGKMPGNDWQKYAGVRALFAYQWAHPGKNLTFMGNEIAQYGEWDHDGSVDWAALEWPDHQGVQKLVADLNTLYKASPALWSQDFDPAGFQWLTSDDADHNTLSFVRIGKDGEQMVVVVNFSGEAWTDYQVPLTKGGKWTEVLTTDDEIYGGSGIHNGTVEAIEGEYHSRDWSAKITVPALGAVFLKPEL